MSLLLTAKVKQTTFGKRNFELPLYQSMVNNVELCLKARVGVLVDEFHMDFDSRALDYYRVFVNISVNFQHISKLE